MVQVFLLVVLFVLYIWLKAFGFCFKKVKLVVLVTLSGLKVCPSYLPTSLKPEEKHGFCGEIFYPTDKPMGPVVL